MQTVRNDIVVTLAWLNWQDVKRCCQEMFTEWLKTQEDASWDQLLEALKCPSVQLIDLVNRIEQMLDVKHVEGKGSLMANYF